MSSFCRGVAFFLAAFQPAVGLPDLLDTCNIIGQGISVASRRAAFCSVQTTKQFPLKRNRKHVGITVPFLKLSETNSCERQHTSPTSQGHLSFEQVEGDVHWNTGVCSHCRRLTVSRHVTIDACQENRLCHTLSSRCGRFIRRVELMPLTGSLTNLRYSL